MDYLRYHISWSNACYSVVKRAASSSIAEAIGRQIGIITDNNLEPNQTPSSVSGWKNYSLGRDGTKSLSTETYHFTFVRNSFSRAVSCWARMTDGNKRLGDWLEEMFDYNPDDPHIASQLRTLKPMPDFVGRFETLERDWKVVQINTELPSLQLRNVNWQIRKGNRLDYRSYYDTRTRHMVAKFYREEIEFFGFKF